MPTYSFFSTFFPVKVTVKVDVSPIAITDTAGLSTIDTLVASRLLSSRYWFNIPHVLPRPLGAPSLRPLALAIARVVESATEKRGLVTEVFPSFETVSGYCS